MPFRDLDESTKRWIYAAAIVILLLLVIAMVGYLSGSWEPLPT